MKGLLMGVVVAGALGAFSGVQAWNEFPGGYRWDHTCLTHEGLYGNYVGEALIQWHVGSSIGDCGEGPDIEVLEADAQDRGGITPTAWTLPGCEADLRCKPGEHYTKCKIWTHLDGLPEGYKEKAIWHEVGHCLGLDHTPWGTFSIMNPGVSAESILQPDDRLAVGTLYPALPRRVFTSIGE